jgi:hypothetical protein
MPPLKQIITVDKQIEEEGRMLLFKNKEKNFKNYFLDSFILLIIFSVLDCGVSIFFTKSFVWWEIPLDIVLSVVIALVSAWLQVRWNRHREKENAYFKEKYGKR